MAWREEVGIRCTGIGELDHSGLGVVPCQCQGHELTPAELYGKAAVELDERLGNSIVGGDERQHRLHRCHDETRREALTGDVGDDDVDASVRAVEHVIEVSRNHAGGQTAGEHIPPGASRLRRWEKAPLDVSSHFQFAPTQLLSHQLLELLALDHLATAVGLELSDHNVSFRQSGQQPVGNQQLVGGLDRGWRHAMPAGQLPVPGKRLALGQLAAHDATSELASDLISQGLRVVGSQMEQDG